VIKNVWIYTSIPVYLHGVIRYNYYAERATGEWGTFHNEELHEVLLSLWNPGGYKRWEMLALLAER
jgi:hypothetical protein